MGIHSTFRSSLTFCPGFEGHPLRKDFPLTVSLNHCDLIGSNQTVNFLSRATRRLGTTKSANVSFTSHSSSPKPSGTWPISNTFCWFHSSSTQKLRVAVAVGADWGRYQGEEACRAQAPSPTTPSARGWQEIESAVVDAYILLMIFHSNTMSGSANYTKVAPGTNTSRAG